MTIRIVHIFRAAKTATQAGSALTYQWIAVLAKTEGPVAAKNAWQALPDAVMGWHGGGETKEQVRMSFPTLEVRMSFPTLETARAWAEAQGFVSVVQPEQKRRVQPKSYASNFAHDRPTPWTH